MQHLPVELLERICSFLCFHCQAPCYFPNADMKDVVSDKASLARFCRVSKSICAVAQPFVFHYYAAGNLTSYYRDLPTRPGYLYSGEPELWSHSSDLLPFVLRSIILRPGLARCVRSLQLITLHHYVEEAFTWEDGPEGDIAPAIRKASTDLGLIAYNVFHPEYMGWVRENLDPEDRPRITIGYVHHTLEQLAILLCPRVSTLLLLADFSPPTGNLLASHGTALTTIALVSHDSRGHYAHAGPILALAPNLHTLHAIDARNHDARARPAPDRLAGVAPFSTSTTTTDSDPRPPPPPLVFPALQKAALHDLGLAALAEFVRNAPALRELRYTETWTEDDGRDPEYYWGLAGCLEPARETLRRLVLRVPVSPRLGAQATSGLGSGLGSSGAVVGLLRGLVRLEVLSVSQEAVYGCGAVGGMVRPLRGGLAGFLPPSLVELCISQVYRDFEGDLRGLARDAPRCLPRLRLVTVGCGDIEITVPQGAEGEVRGFFGEKIRTELREVFAEVGILLTWGPLIEDEGGDVPGLPVYESRPDGDSGWLWELVIQ